MLVLLLVRGRVVVPQLIEAAARVVVIEHVGQAGAVDVRLPGGVRQVVQRNVPVLSLYASG